MQPIDQQHTTLPAQAAPLPAASAPNIPIHENIQPRWHERSINYIDHLIPPTPNFFIQNRLDDFGQMIEGLFAPLSDFNKELNSNGHGEWYNQLAHFLIKLPFRAVRNILNLLYNIVKGIVYAAVHPIEALKNVAKLLITLINELTKPDTWAKMGAGVIGGSIGQSIVTGNPLTLVGMGIGVALLAGGLAAGAIKTGVQKGSIKDYLFEMAPKLAESAVTGLIMGLIMGGIQKAIGMPQDYKITNPDDARKFADSFSSNNSLPPCSEVYADPSGKMTLIWENLSKGMYPKVFGVSTNSQPFYEFSLKLSLTPNTSIASIGQIQYGYFFSGGTRVLSQNFYPISVSHEILSRLGAEAGAIGGVL